jgi:asparagine synthase (glutamine-hydrolysing)
VRRFWLPDPSKELWYGNPEDYYRPFREHLLKSVQKRLKSDYPIVLQLSGGLDSPSIALLAASAFRQGDSDLPPIHTVSVLFPGLDCDEREKINALSKKLPFKQHRCDPLEDSSADSLCECLWQLDSPFANPQRNIDMVYRRCVHGLGARRMITGLGGDETVDAWGLLHDLAVRWRFVRLLRETRSFNGHASISIMKLMHFSASRTTPEWIKALLRPVLRRESTRTSWSNPAFEAPFRARKAGQESIPAFRSQTQQNVFNNVYHALTFHLLDNCEVTSSYSGFELCHPFFDRDFVEFVLSIPFERRILSGHWKSLLRCSFREVLPPAILEPARKVVFDSHLKHALRRAIPELRQRLFEAESWHSEKYVDGQKALRLLSSDAELPAIRLDDAWRVATVELWLRTLKRYGSLCSDSTGDWGNGQGTPKDAGSWEQKAV